MKSLIYLAMLLAIATAGGGCTFLRAEVHVLQKDLLEASRDLRKAEETAERISASKDKAIAKSSAFIESSNTLSALRKDFSAQVTKDDPVAQAQLSAETSAIEQTLADLAVKAGVAPATATASNLDFDKDAALVAHAPRRFWKKRREYDIAWGYGFIGNTDIAIVQEETFKFTVKGLRVEGSKIPKVTLSLTRQLMAAVAASQGIPTSFVKGSDASGAAVMGDAYDQTAELTALATAQATNNAKALRSRQAMLQLIEAIGSTPAADLADDSKRAATIANLQKVTQETLPVIEMK